MICSTYDTTTISEQPEYIGYNNSPVNECYHADVTTFDMHSDFSHIHDISRTGFHENSHTLCQLAETDWTNDNNNTTAGTFWNDMDELGEFRR